MVSRDYSRIETEELSFWIDEKHFVGSFKIYFESDVTTDWDRDLPNDTYELDVDENSIDIIDCNVFDDDGNSYEIDFINEHYNEIIRQINLKTLCEKYHEFNSED